MSQLEAGDGLVLVVQLDGADLVHLPPLDPHQVIEIEIRCSRVIHKRYLPDVTNLNQKGQDRLRSELYIYDTVYKDTVSYSSDPRQVLNLIIDQ